MSKYKVGENICNSDCKYTDPLFIKSLYKSIRKGQKSKRKIGRRFQQTVHKIRNTDGSYTYKEMLSLVIKEMQIKSERYHFLLITLIKLGTFNYILCQQGLWRNRNSDTLGM